MQSDRYQSPDNSNLVEQAEEDFQVNYSPNDKCIQYNIFLNSIF